MPSFAESDREWKQFPPTKETAPILSDALNRIWREAHMKNCHPTQIVSILETARKRCRRMAVAERRFEAAVETERVETAGSEIDEIQA